MRKGLVTLIIIAVAVFFGENAFSQVDFKVKNESGYELYGLMISQDGGNDWTNDLLTDSEFPNGTQTVITIPEGYTCEIYIKVTYKVDGELYEELLARANVCGNNKGIRIKANPNGSSGHWMTTQYLSN